MSYIHIHIHMYMYIPTTVITEDCSDHDVWHLLDANLDADYATISK